MVGVFTVVAIVILTKSHTFSSVAALLTAVIIACIPEVIKDDKVPRLLPCVVFGGFAGIPVYLLIFSPLNLHMSGPSTTPALQSIAPEGGSNRGVGANGKAIFNVTVPSGFTKLHVTFFAKNSQGFTDNCVPGSSLTVSSAFNAASSAPQTLPQNKRIEIDIPGGVSKFQIVVQFIPQTGYYSCHEDIEIAQSANFAR